MAYNRRPRHFFASQSFNNQAAPANKPVNVNITVRDNNVEQALRVLKKKMLQEGVFGEVKRKAHFEGTAEKRVRKRGKSKSRWEKQRRKEMANDGVASKPPFGPI